ncbi:MAG TPA: alkaline phosphatase D family protein [Ktedonobacteraceae bacterium]|nr:alkaline phosphatase D family protein [Ktedonobacteraceae bacterium]
MVQLLVGPIVRATDTTSVVIWVEVSHACSITLRVAPYSEQENEVGSTIVHTLMVGGHHYAAPQLQGLQPSTWYHYELFTDDAPLTDPFAPLLQCFRTLGSKETEEVPIRFIYGSCRKLDRPEDDTFNALGGWLLQQVEQREQVWPHLLLLIGDQIYADEPPANFLQLYKDIAGNDGITTFTNFSRLYEYAWTAEKGVRQVLATIPTYMIFDDHEVYNSWGVFPGWKEEMVRCDKEQLLVDGLVAYWIYQGWGNLLEREQSQHPLLQIIQAAEKSGEDALEALRTCIRDNFYGRNKLAWHYTLPTTPPIFVTNTRADRTSVFDPAHTDAFYAPMHIMSQQQTTDLRDWMQQHDREMAILVSSVPVLLPPLIGLVEYLAGVRLWSRSNGLLHWIGKQLARLQLQFALRESFDHWPIFAASWHDLLRMLKKRERDILLLSGDVHFSYALEGRKLFTKGTSTRFYQLVSTPFQNTLTSRQRWMIEKQSLITRMAYSGLRTRILPLQQIEKAAQIRHHLLFNDTLAYVTLQPQSEHKYSIEQAYMSIVAGQLEIIARTRFPREKA